MKTFAFYIQDDRYTVPTLKLEILAGDEEAEERAHSLLRQSPHHLGVEVCAEGVRLFGVGTLADDAGAPPAGRVPSADTGDQVSAGMR